MVEEAEKSDKAPDPEEDTEVIASPLKRTAMVIFSPQLVFESLRASSSRLDWIIPMTLSVLFSLALVNIGRPFLMNDQMEAAVERIENNTNLTEDQKTAALNQVKEGMENMAGFTTVMTNVGAVVGAFVAVAVIALIMKAVVAVSLHGILTFGAGFTIAALASMVTLLGGVVRLPLIFYFESFKQSALSLGFFFPEDLRDSFLVKLVDFDLFTLWYLIVISIGMAVFAKSSVKKALIPMAGLWLVYRAGVTAVSIWMGGLGG